MSFSNPQSPSFADFAARPSALGSTVDCDSLVRRRPLKNRCACFGAESLVQILEDSERISMPKSEASNSGGYSRKDLIALAHGLGVPSFSYANRTAFAKEPCGPRTPIWIQRNSTHDTRQPVLFRSESRTPIRFPTDTISVSSAVMSLPFIGVFSIVSMFMSASRWISPPTNSASSRVAALR